ncbi:VOC family protein [Polluticaenibacter yanchengensis]|uniref:VOC family protein n=1 Tax=Polluticaenibacter yanchengensis TaxID=3014562 RepID=A0ABT4UJA1_9BACT|nr:VOC family protein [Chitinophagaceae bacterium LY-5]
MTFRVARHTTDLKVIEQFYKTIVGLENLGGFKNHDSYDGLFLGQKDSDWHLEFTTSTDQPQHQADEDDILVFYVNAEIELARIKQIIKQQNITTEFPKNPYWRTNGIQISDPDGFKVIFSLKEMPLDANDPLTILVKERDIQTWGALIDFTRNLPYGRNLNREDLSLVIKENKGTCSSKHAFLKRMADLNSIKNVQLILGIYRMDHLNTPKIGDTLLEHGLEYMPEAHCYLLLNNRRVDITNRNSDIENLCNHIIEEIEIGPVQVNTYKIEYHKNFLRKWQQENNIHLSFDELWKIRESCIRKLEG